MFFEGLCGEISIFCGRQTTDRQTDKTDCLTPLRACARGVINFRVKIAAGPLISEGVQILQSIGPLGGPLFSEGV